MLCLDAEKWTVNRVSPATQEADNSRRLWKWTQDTASSRLSTARARTGSSVHTPNSKKTLHGEQSEVQAVISCVDSELSEVPHPGKVCSYHSTLREPQYFSAFKSCQQAREAQRVKPRALRRWDQAFQMKLDGLARAVHRGLRRSKLHPLV